MTFNADASTDPAGQPLTYSWNFGDGASAAGGTVSHAYAAPGTYALSLTATNKASLTSTAQASVVIVSAQQSGLRGVVHGGQQPVSGSTIQLWQVGTTGYGTGAAPLGSSSTTNAQGEFNFGSFTCASTTGGNNSLIYITATGGNPGAGAGANNSALAMIVALGSCGNVTATSYVSINELTTVATVYALAQFMSPSGGIGSYATSTQGLVNAFATVGNLVNTATGAAYSVTPGGNGIVPQTELNSLADIIATCINTAGPSSYECTTLFADVTPAGSPAPTTTISALLDIALNPGATYATPLLNLIEPAAPFQPFLQSTNDWTLAVGYASGGSSPKSVALDSLGNVWIANYGTGGATSSISLVSSLGAPANNSPLVNSATINGATALAIDTGNNVWIANHDNNSASELTATAANGSYTINSGNPSLTGIGLVTPDAVAIDPSNNVWFANNGGNSVVSIPNTGCNSLQCATTYTGGGLSAPLGIALDSGGKAWVTDGTGAAVTKITPGGTPVSFIGGGLTNPSALAIDGNSNIWVTDSALSLVSELNPVGLALSPSSGFTGAGLAGSSAVAIDGSGAIWVADAATSQLSVLNSAGVPITLATGYKGGSLSSPSAIAIDASGNVWVTNGSPTTSSSQSITLTEFVGAAVPAFMPLAQGVALGELGQEPGSPAVAKPPTSNAGGPYLGTVGTSITFNGAASTDPKDQTLSYAWNFGDGASATGVAPAHTYVAAGTFTVSLTVTDAAGLQGAVNTSAIIGVSSAAAPTASAGGPYSGTAYAALQFSATLSTDPAVPTGSTSSLSYMWNFGDGTSGVGPAPVHTYTSAGTFTVSVTVQSAASGQLNTATTTATIAAGSAPVGAPTANANGPYTAQAGTNVSFSSAGSTDPNSQPLTYLWTFGTGGSSSSPNPTFIYSQAGVYSISLTVSNPTSSTTVGTIVTITAPPLAALVIKTGGPYTVPVNQPLMLSAAGTNDPSQRQLTYTWDFGDGTQGTGLAPVHTYSKSGNYTVSLNVNDGATLNGNATTSATVGGPAAEALTASIGGPYQNVTNQPVTFNGSLSTDNLGNPLSYTWNYGDGSTGTGVTPSHTYTAPGTYTVSLTVASDGISATATTSVPITNPISVQITTPVADALFGVNLITVSGTTSAPNLTVTVNGVAAQVSGSNFTATGVSLREGVNLISASATDGNGGSGVGAVSVILDVTAPTISITTPAANSTVQSSSIAVAGLVNDSVTGTIGSNNVKVTVNGQPAQVSNRSYMLPSLQLVPGPNTLTVVATDNVGNTGQTVQTVNLLPATNQLSIVKLAGDSQTGAVKSVLGQALSVQLVSASGSPIAGRPVTFTVTRSDGMVEVMPNTAQALSVTTDANGKASVLFQLGSRSGLGVNQVSATTPGAGGPALFTASSTAGSPTQIHEVIGQNQRGLLGQQLAQGMQVIVEDAQGNPVPGVTVNYTPVGSMDGSIDNRAPVTDVNGRTLANLTIGQQEGINNYSTTADFAGDPGHPVTFIASAYATGEVSMTSVSGTVLDNSNTPVQNATITITGTTLATTTNASGNFTLSGAPVGAITLTVDGSTAISTSTFPFLSFVVEDLPGQNNTLGKPIYMPFIDVNDAQTVGSSEAVTLTMAGVPGVAFLIAPNSVTFPDGSKVGKLSLSQVKSDEVPMEPANGTAPNLVWTLQPAGTRFSVPVQVTLPNTQALPPGFVSEMYQYDHDLEQFVSFGTGHVSADGSVIVSDPGFGITKAGWGHGCNIPVPPTCTVSCGHISECIVATPDIPNCRCTIQFLSGTACGRTPTDLECHLPGKCQSGLCNSNPVANGTECGTGQSLLCSAQTCQGGSCATQTVADQPLGLVPGSQKGLNITVGLQAATQPLITFLKTISGQDVGITPAVTAADQETLVCCEALKMQNVPTYETGITGSITFELPKFPLLSPVPPFLPLAINIPKLGPQGLFGQFSGMVGAGFTHNVNDCTKVDCYKGTVALGLSGNFGFTIGNPEILSGTISVTSGFGGSVTADCKQLTSNIIFSGVTAQANVTFLDLSVQLGSYAVINAHMYTATYDFPTTGGN